MRRNEINANSRTTRKFGLTVGIDLGDCQSRLCVLDGEGDVVEESSIRTTEGAFRQRFSTPSCLIAIETGAHSPWVSRLLQSLGHQVLVANARKVRLIFESDKKNDRVDARSLARLARLDPSLLSPIRHRDAGLQSDLAVIRSRDSLVRCRTQLINTSRGLVKSTGHRLPKCDARSFHERVVGRIPETLLPALLPLQTQVLELTKRIHELDKYIEILGKEKYPQTRLLRQITGVGPITALCFVLVIGDPHRFPASREVGAYLGLRPREDQSGQTRRQLGITKSGDHLLRCLLVQSAQYILGPFGAECDLRTWGLVLAQRGGANGKKRAVVAVARKLAVLLHHLWVTGEVYKPQRAVVSEAPVAA